MAKVIGRVWATRKDPSFEGRRLLVLQPLTFDHEKSGDPLVALDTVDSGAGDLVIYVSSTEATVPFKPGATPTDATIVGVLDRVDTISGSWKAGEA